LALSSRTADTFLNTTSVDNTGGDSAKSVKVNFQTRAKTVRATGTGQNYEWQVESVEYLDAVLRQQCETVHMNKAFDCFGAHQLMVGVAYLFGQENMCYFRDFYRRCDAWNLSISYIVQEINVLLWHTH